MYIASIESSKKNHDLSSTAFYQWHNRLRHHAHNTVKSIMISCNVPPNNKMHYAFCSAYCLGTIHNFPFPLSSNEYSSPLQLFHTDLWAPSPTPSSNGNRYYIHFIDECTNFTWVYMLRDKSEAFKTFCHFKTHVEFQLDFKIKSIQSDWVGKYQAFTDFLQDNGIHHPISCPALTNKTVQRKRKQHIA